MSDELSEQIRDLIASEGLSEGARLPSERDLAERFRASRPTISQALRRLALMGMVEIRRGSGAYVLRRPQAMMTDSVKLMLDLDRRSIGDLMQLRLWLETLGVEQAAQRSEPLAASEIVSLASALTRLADVSESASRWIAADTVFHAAVIGLTDNSFLTAFYESVHTAALTWEYDEWLRTETEPEWIHTTTSEEHLALHEPIMSAVVNRDPARAREAVAAHHQCMLEHLEQARGPIDRSA